MHADGHVAAATPKIHEHLARAMGYFPVNIRSPINRENIIAALRIKPARWRSCAHRPRSACAGRSRGAGSSAGIQLYGAAAAERARSACSE